MELDDRAWSELDDAYGKSGTISSLLVKLEELPAAESWKSEPYYSLWSALCYQGEVFTASYAAFPHLVRIVGANSHRKEAFKALQLADCIEAARLTGSGPALPSTLAPSYEDALAALPRIVLGLLTLASDRDEARILCAALAVSAQQGELALDILDPE